MQLRLKFQFSHTEITLKAIEIPHVCQDIEESASSPFVAEIQRDGKGITDQLLYRSIVGEEGIRVLIGSDQMWMVMTERSLDAQATRRLLL